MVTLTSLLVLAALFTQTSQSIPKTAYLKLIDVWYIALIIIDFLIIISVVIIENLRLAEINKNNIPLESSILKIVPSEVTEVNAPGNLPRSYNKAVLFNNTCRAVFPFFVLLLLLGIAFMAQDL